MANKGFTKLQIHLGNLANTSIVQKALSRACILIENSAKMNITINGSVDSGNLRNSITHEIDGTVGVVGTNVEYAPYVEYGTGLFAADGAGRKDVPWRYQDAKGEWHTTSGQHPKPFLEPAIIENADKIIDIFNEAIKEELK